VGTERLQSSLGDQYTGVSVFAYPITHRFGPVVYYNVLCLLAPTSAAWSAFLLCRSIVRAFWPASYTDQRPPGFSPNVNIKVRAIVARCLLMVRFNSKVTQIGHYQFSAVTARLTGEFLTRPSRCHSDYSGRFGDRFRAADPSRRREARYLVEPLATCMRTRRDGFAANSIPLLRLRTERTSVNKSRPDSADLLNFLLPTDNFSGNTSYLGIPLLAVLLVFAVCYWSKLSVTLLTFALLFVCLAPLGPALHCSWRTLNYFALVIASHSPLIDQALPGRLSLYSFLIAELITAVYLGDPTRRGSTRLIVAGLILLFSLPTSSYFRCKTSHK
jgi:hypothetical protein